MLTAAKYQQTQVMTASPMELILMLYDECIQSLEKAEQAFHTDSTDRIQNVNNNILHAEDIITELAVSLDMERGGEVAKNLHKLYDFMIYHLSQANVKQIDKPIVDVRKMMIEMREAWQKVSSEEPARENPEYSSPRSSISVNG